MAEDKKTNSADLFLLEAWVSDNPGSHMFLKLAKAYREQKRLDEAIKVLERGLIMQPGTIEARNLLAEILQEKGDLKGALAQYLEAANEIVKHADVFDNLSNILALEEEPVKAQAAKEAYEALSSVFAPEKIQAKKPEVSTAEIKNARGHLEEAAAVFKEMDQEKPLTEKQSPKTEEKDLYTINLLNGLNKLKQAALERVNA